MMDVADVLIDGRWRAAHAESTFKAENPATSEALGMSFPLSEWADCELALAAAADAAVTMGSTSPGQLSAFLEA
jgi:alpha-ketoglutaric semialdehyde dehydrogenase